MDCPPQLLFIPQAIAPPTARAVGVADGQRQRVGRIVRLGYRRQAQQDAGHLHHLLFFRLAVAHHRLLDLHGRVFAHLHPALGACQQDDAPGLRHIDAGGLVVGEVQLFNRQDIRVVSLQDGVHVLIDHPQPLGKIHPRRGRDRAVAFDGKPAVPIVQHAPAHNRVARVDPQNNQLFPSRLGLHTVLL